MECKKCKNKIVLWGFSKFNCNICKEEKDCVHTPAVKYCLECAEKNNICENCGKSLN